MSGRHGVHPVPGDPHGHQYAERGYPMRAGPTRHDKEGGTMPLTFRKSFRILPGVRLNINKRSWSITTGGRNGPRHTRSSTGRRTTSMDLPGPFGWRRTTTSGRR